MELRENVQLAPYTTFRIGGPARWFADVSSERDVAEAVIFAREHQLPLFILGGGSNILVADSGFHGLVLHICHRGIVESPNGLFTVAAGENWDAFVSHAVERECAGIECLAGIPGTIGGTPIQNVGAYGQEVASTITFVRALDLRSMSFIALSASQCGFAYRQSIFNTSERDRYIVTGVSFQLTPGGATLLTYKDLQRYFENQPAPTLVETAAAVRTIRHAKGMILVEGEADCRSAGSFFKNPMVAQSLVERISTTLSIDAARIPHYPAEGGKTKLSAAWLLEQAGFQKGFALGRASLSTRHTLALTNRANAKAEDILALRDIIIHAVNQRFGITLEAEPILVG